MPFTNDNFVEENRSQPTSQEFFVHALYDVDGLPSGNTLGQRFIERGGSRTLDQGARFLGTWDTASSLGVEAQGQRWRPAGRLSQMTTMALPTYQTATLTRKWQAAEGLELLKKLENIVGRNTCRLLTLFLDRDLYLHPRRGFSSRGQITRVSPPDTDSNSTDIATIEIEFAIRDRSWL